MMFGLIKKLKKKSTTRKSYYSKNDLTQLDLKKAKKRRQSQIKKIKNLNRSLKSMSINDSNEESLGSYDEDDDAFESDKETSKTVNPDNFLNNLRKFTQAIPTNKCSFKEKRQKSICINFCCTIDYFLLSLWTTTQFSEKYLKECQSKGGIYLLLIEIIKLIDQGSWAKAKNLWLTKCLKIKETSSNNTSIVFNCRGDIHSYFVKLMPSFQSFKIFEQNCDLRDPITDDKIWSAQFNAY